MIRIFLWALQIFIDVIVYFQISMRFVDQFTAHSVNCLCGAIENQIDCQIFDFFTVQIHSLWIFPQSKTFEIVGGSWGVRVSAISTIHFNFIKSRSPSIRFDNDSQLLKFLPLKFQMIKLVLLLFWKHKPHFSINIHMLNITPVWVYLVLNLFLWRLNHQEQIFIHFQPLFPHITRVYLLLQTVN